MSTDSDINSITLYVQDGEFLATVSYSDGSPAEHLTGTSFSDLLVQLTEFMA